MCYPQALGLTLLYLIYWVSSCISWKSLSYAVEQFLQYVYLPQGCMQFTAEPTTCSPTCQFLNLNWKIKMLFEFQEEANDACRAVTLRGIFSRPWEQKQLKHMLLPPWRKQGQVHSRKNKPHISSQPRYYLSVAGLPVRAGVWALWHGVSSRPAMPQRTDKPGNDSTPADSHLLRRMARAAVPGQSLQNPNWYEC